MSRINNGLMFAVMLALAPHVNAGEGCKNLDPATHTEQARRCLNPGYSLLYLTAHSLPDMHWLLMFKDQSKRVEELVGTTLDFYRKQTQDLERMARQHPDLDIKLDSIPTILQRAREAQLQDRFKQLRPLVGKSGAPFERDLLLFIRDLVDGQRHLVGVMQDEEPSADLRRYLEETRVSLDHLYSRYDDLLNQYYFASGKP